MSTDSTILEGFRTELKSVRGLADNSIKNYMQEVGNLLSFLQARNAKVKSSTREDLIAWRESLSSRADSGIALAFSAARALFKFLDIADRFPDFRISIKEQESTDVPTVAQFLEMRKKLKQPIADPRCVPSITRQAVFETLAGTALRIGALLTLRKKHLFLDHARPYIMVVASEMECKGKKAGAVPISPYACSVLAQHLALVPRQDNDLVFDLSQSVVRKILDKIAPDGLKMKPHSLRHFGCSMTYFRNYDGGRCDPVWVRDFAAHDSIATTDVYLKMARRVCQSDEEWLAWAIGE